MEQEEKKYSILIIDDEIVNLKTLSSMLSEEYTVYTINNGKEGLEFAKTRMPTVILLDILMPDMDGYEVFMELINDGKTRNIPILFVTALDNEESEEKGLDMGAADYITKPFNPTAVKLRVRNQIQMLNQIELIKELSATDQLTRIPNRRSFDYRFNLEWDRARRSKKPLSLLLIDIDNFKIYNDTHGHLQGDAALQEIAKTAHQSLRRSLDFIARWGGEEFGVLLTDTNSYGAMIVAENIRKNVESLTIPDKNNEGTKVTISIGVNTHIPEKNESADELFNGADKALYEAKKTGKNRVCLYNK